MKKKKKIENETRRGTGDDGIGAISRSTGNARGNEARPVAASGIVVLDERNYTHIL